MARVSCDDGDLVMAMVGNGVGWQWQWLAMAMVGSGNGRPVAKSGDWEKYI